MSRGPLVEALRNVSRGMRQLLRALAHPWWTGPPRARRFAANTTFAACDTAAVDESAGHNR